MTPRALADFVTEIIREKTLPIKEILKNSLLIPENFLGLSEEFFVIINEQKYVVFRDIGFMITSIACDHSNMICGNHQTAAYNPNFKAIQYSTQLVQSESQASGMAEEALIEILTLHELVHTLMMSHYPLVEKGWPFDENLRYIHEAIALKCGKDLFGEIYSTAAAQNVNKYLQLVETAIPQSSVGHTYRPFFDTFQNIDTPKFWKVLVESVPADLAPLQPPI